MSNCAKETESVPEGFKNAATRQRWDLFHRAIALAKQSNREALIDEQECDTAASQQSQLTTVST